MKTSSESDYNMLRYMLKTAGDVIEKYDKKIDKLQPQLKQYDRVRDIANGLPVGADYQSKKYGMDLVNKVQKLRRKFGNVEDKGTDVSELRERLARILASSRYYNNEEAVLGMHNAAHQEALRYGLGQSFIPRPVITI